MNRETWIPIAGLVGLFLTGSAMLYATSGPPKPPKERAAARPGQPGVTKAKPAPGKREQLVFKTPVGDRPAAAEGAKNVVLVVLSAARRDQLTPYGGDPKVTPWLDGLARAGVRFDDTIAAGGWALPAHIALSTGDHALALGMVEPSKRGNQLVLPDEVVTLPERLVEKGYHTLVVNGEPPAGRAAGLGQGVDHYRDTSVQGYAVQSKLRAPQVVDIATNMLTRRSDDEKARPFYLQLNIVDLHKPIKTPPEQFKPFEGPDHKIAPYRAVCNRIDEALKKLDERLAEQGLADDTYVVVVGATGEGLNMPETHGKTHGRAVYESIGRIPWIVRGPGVPAGGVVGGLASQIDVMPTVMGLLGLPVTEPGLPGSDWSAQVRGELATTDRLEAILDTWYFAANRAAIYTPTQACMIDFGSGEVEGEIYADGCFDRKADPDWMKPIQAPELAEKLRTWRKQAQQRGAKLAVIARPAPSEDAAPQSKAKSKTKEPDQEG